MDNFLAAKDYFVGSKTLTASIKYVTSCTKI